jgi:hypothetical protein
VKRAGIMMSSVTIVEITAPNLGIIVVVKVDKGIKPVKGIIERIE